MFAAQIDGDHLAEGAHLLVGASTAMIVGGGAGFDEASAT